MELNFFPPQNQSHAVGSRTFTLHGCVLLVVALNDAVFTGRNTEVACASHSTYPRKPRWSLVVRVSRQRSYPVSVSSHELAVRARLCSHRSMPSVQLFSKRRSPKKQGNSTFNTDRKERDNASAPSREKRTDERAFPKGQR